MMGLSRPRLPRTKAVRRAVRAPELERFLAREHIDLLVTDQIEALQVRVRRGIEVLDQRVTQGLRVARRRITALLTTTVAGFALAALHIFASAQGVFRGGGLSTLVLWSLAALAFLVSVAVIPALLRAFLDWRLLSRLRGRYAGGVERAKSMEELLAFAEKALEEARAVGMVPVSLRE